MPCGLCAASPAIKPSGSNPPVQIGQDEQKTFIRPSQLPIYSVNDTSDTLR